MRTRVTEQELRDAITEFLAESTDEELREEVGRLEMELASPGDWQAVEAQAETSS